jgi:predicted DNA-binding transcriptional regulator AlpA
VTKRNPFNIIPHPIPAADQRSAVSAVCQRAALPYAQTLKALNRDPDFPKPVISQGNAKRWHAKDVDAWAAKHREKSRRTQGWSSTATAVACLIETNLCR